MAIVREVSQGDKGTVQDNSHTADAFAEIIGLLPKTVVRLRDIGFVSRWIGVRFNNGRIGYVLDKGALRSFLASGNRRDWRKALEILRHCTAFRWAEKKREQPVPMVDVHSLGALIEHHASAFGRKLGADAVRLFEERVHGVFSRRGREDRSDMIRPAIEEHDQNRGAMEFENCLVFGLREALLAWCMADAGRVREYVRALLESDSQILRRMGIYVLNQRWADLSGLYAKAVKPELFDYGHIHELYALLQRRFPSLSDRVKERTLEAIRSLPEPETGDAVASRKVIQLRWLDAVKDAGYEPAVASRRALQDETNGSDVEHPEFRIYTEVRSGPGPSPYQIAELVAFAESGVIADRLNDFEPLERWRGPSPEGLAAALAGAVAAAPEILIRALPQLLNAKAEYRCGVLHALRDLWDQSKRSDVAVSWKRAWPRILGFLEQLAAEPSFWKHVNERTTEGWIASAIADLLERGTREDAQAYPEELLPQGLRLIRRLLDEVKPTASGNEADPMGAAINTPKGRSIEALFAHALRHCRISDRDSGSHDGAWLDIQFLFDEELARCRRTNYEFSTLAGAYLTNLYYMNAQWVENSLSAVFSDDHDAFVSAIGGLAYSRPTRRVYGLLRDERIIDRALGAELRGRDVREKLVERILLAFLWEEETIDSPRMTFPFVHGIAEDLRAAASFLWMIRKDQLTDAQRDKVVEYWTACNNWAASQDTPTEALFDALGHLAWALRDVESRNRKLLLAVVPHMAHRHNTYELLKELIRLVKVSPSGVGAVFRAVVDNKPPVYDYEDRVRTLIEELSGAGEREVAIYCANRLITLAGIGEIYERLIETS